MPQPTVDDMATVIEKMRNITDYLEDNNRKEIANKLGHITHVLMHTFWDISVLINNEIVKPEQADRNNENDKNTPSEYAYGQTVHQELQDMMEGVQQMPSQNNDIGGCPPGANSWATIAAATPAQLHTNGGPVGMINGSSSINRNMLPVAPIRPKPATMPFVHKKDPAVPIHPAVRAEPAPAKEGLEGKSGIIVVTGAFPLGCLNFLTARIHEGALYSVEIEYASGYAEITFQNAHEARDFLMQDRLATEKTGHGRFGPGFSIDYTKYRECGWDKDMAKMGLTGGCRERRRLTFVRSGLLSKAYALRRLQETIEMIAGYDGIDFIWAFNAGNALAVTAAFKSVRTARLVKEHFLLKACKSAPYIGIQVTYSTDPCEKELHLSRG
ncbi:hypothetical protein FQN51_005657 [Onygenales sp. PD_10]|nr:hypothetical protein FQN51_005657 [Onygenales sp. PD_10]